jgi:aryl-alcohol dehydrogenase-like predicted oxidoreductase
MDMKHNRLGNSGLEVSAITLGCMSFGEPNVGNHGWTLPEEESRPLIKKALELGITTFDTANSYSAGRSEEIVGAALRDFARREDVVIATKVYFPMRSAPNGGGLSRGHILEQVDASLRRLGTDYIDLYQIHRWDPEVPIEETMSTLNDLVRCGKVRYIGASTMWAWQFAKAQFTARMHGWAEFISMQAQYNLLAREDEREMYPLCRDMGVGALPWSPLARGKLTRPWEAESSRFETDLIAQSFYNDNADSDRRTVQHVHDIAADHGVPAAQIALSWVISRPVVSSPIVGATKPAHLDDAVRALDVQLTEEELTVLGSAYTPRRPEGYA